MAVDKQRVDRMAGNYPMQTGWLLAKCAHMREQIDDALTALPARKCNADARAQLLQMRDYLAADKALFDAIAAAEEIR